MTLNEKTEKPSTSLPKTSLLLAKGTWLRNLTPWCLKFLGRWLKGYQWCHHILGRQT
jgi:hypothetical protein